MENQQGLAKTYARNKHSVTKPETFSPRVRARSEGPRRISPRPRAGAAHDPTCQPALLPRGRKAPAANRYRSLRQEGPRNPQNAPYVHASSTQAGRWWSTWRGTRRTRPPRRKTGRRPPSSSRDGQLDLRGTLLTPSAPLPRAPHNAAAPKGGEEWGRRGPGG